MTDNISHAKNNINSENYEIALQFLDKELEQNPNKITNEIFYYKGIVLTHIGAIKGEKLLIKSGIQFLERLVASELDCDLIHFPDIKEKLDWARKKRDEL